MPLRLTVDGPTVPSQSRHSPTQSQTVESTVPTSAFSLLHLALSTALSLSLDNYRTLSSPVQPPVRPFVRPSFLPTLLFYVSMYPIGVRICPSHPGGPRSMTAAQVGSAAGQLGRARRSVGAYSDLTAVCRRRAGAAFSIVRLFFVASTAQPTYRAAVLRFDPRRPTRLPACRLSR